MDVCYIKLRSQQDVPVAQIEREKRTSRSTQCMTLLNTLLEQLARLGTYPYLLVAHGIGHAAGAGARHPSLRGNPLALQLGRVRGDYSLGHQHGGQAGIGC